MRSMIRRLTALFVTAAMLCVMTSCNIIDLADRIKEGNETISGAEIARLMIDAINNKNDVAESYSSIPEKQRDGLSFSYFTEYIDILRNLSRNNGTIDSFRFLTEQEMSSLDIDDEFSVVVFEYSSNPDPMPVYIYLDVNSDGITYLSDETVTDIISIWNYADHYFTMMEEQNIEGIYTLLNPIYSDEELSDEAIYARASALSDFYYTRVRSPRDEYEISKLTPDSMTIVIPEIINEDGESYSDHSVEIVKNYEKDMYEIDDTIPLETDPFLTYLIDGGTKLVHCGNSYTSTIINNMVGKPTYISHGIDGIDMRVAENGVDIEYEHKILVNYPGLILVFEGYGNSEKWDGELTGFRLYDTTELNVGYSVYIGMPKSELQSVYPFIDLYDYQLTYSAPEADYSIEFEFDDEDNLDLVRVSKVI